MQGTSGAELFYIVDEASGVAREIFEAIEGNTRGGGKILLFGNPTQLSGEFYDAFHGKSNLYKCISISAEDTPNVRTGEMVIEGLATRDGILEARIAWGPDYLNDPRYQIRILGQFPAQSTYSVISMADLQNALEQWWKLACSVLGREDLLTNPRERAKLLARPGAIELIRGEWESGNEALVLGVDPARFGEDLSVITGRRALRAFYPVSVKKFDGPNVAEVALRTLDRFKHGVERPRIYVDAIGIGTSVVDVLMRQNDVVCIPIVSSEKATDDELYANLRAEIYFRTAEWIRAGGGFEPLQVLQDDLMAPRYSFERRSSRLIVEPKDLIKKRIGRSPDFGDSFGLMTLFRDQPRSSGKPNLTKKQIPPDAGSRWGDMPGRGF
jgi:phage terminase large subunit